MSTDAEDTGSELSRFDTRKPLLHETRLSEYCLARANCDSGLGLSYYPSALFNVGDCVSGP